MRLAALPLALALAAPACAQGHDSNLISREELPDGRTIDLYGDGGAGYRLDFSSTDIQPAFAARANDTRLADIDGDGALDLVVLLPDPQVNGPLGAHIWDLTLDRPYLMHVSSGVTSAEAAVEDVTREVRGRFALDNGVAALDYLNDALAAIPESGALGWETANLAMPNHFNTIEGVLIHARVREARSALDALTARPVCGEAAPGQDAGCADPGAIEAAADDLVDAIAARENYARAGRSQVYD